MCYVLHRENKNQHMHTFVRFPHSVTLLMASCMGGWDMVRGGRDGGRGVWSEGGMGGGRE